MTDTKRFLFNLPLLACFLIPIGYWIYLLLTAKTIIVFDSVEYEHLGNMLYHQGWVEYFKTGPNREPLYPLFIAFSMKLADVFSLPYILILKVIQISILFLSQCLIYRLLKRLQIRETIVGLTILYWGISPAIVNSALSLYSEV